MAYGVPNPYVATTHPWPTRFHGAIFTRPTFGMPYQRSVASVFKPSDFNDGNPALRGLGELLVNAENGVFGTARNGGGVFGPSLYGLGSLGAGGAGVPSAGSGVAAPASSSSCPMPAVCAQVKSSAPARALMDMSLLDPFGNFGKYCADPAYQAHITDKCAAAIAAVLAGARVAAPPATLPPTAGSTVSPLKGQGSGESGDPRVSELQGYLNRVLATAGLGTLTQDGKLGAKGCGAIAWYRGSGRSLASATTAAAIDANLSAMGAIYSSVCAAKGATAPARTAAVSTVTTTTSTLPQTETAPEPAKASMMSAGTWAMVGGGLLAVGLAVVGKKKGWF